MLFPVRACCVPRLRLFADEFSLKVTSKQVHDLFSAHVLLSSVMSADVIQKLTALKSTARVMKAEYVLAGCDSQGEVEHNARTCCSKSRTLCTATPNIHTRFAQVIVLTERIELQHPTSTSDLHEFQRMRFCTTCTACLKGRLQAFSANPPILILLTK